MASGCTQATTHPARQQEWALKLVLIQTSYAYKTPGLKHRFSQLTSAKAEFFYFLFGIPQIGQ